MPQTFDYMGALREGYTPKEIKRFVKGLDQQNDLEQRGTKFVQKQARQREAVNSMMENSRSRASAGLTPAETLYPAGVTRDPIGQDIQNTAAAPNVPRPTGIVRAENVAPDLVSAFEQAPESSLGDATSGYLAEAPSVKLRGARGIVQGIKDAPKAGWLGLNQAASAGMQAIGDVMQEDIGILTKAAKATSDLLTLNLSPTEIPADTGSNVIQRVGRDAYAAHTQGMQELSDKYAPDSWGGAVMNAGAQAGQQLGILGTAAAIGIRNPAAMTNFSLGALGAQSGLTEYGDARAKGFDVPRSLLKAGVGGGMEVVTEVAPMGKLVNFMTAPAKKGVAAFLKDAAEYGLQDIGGELLNTMITDVVNGKMQARPNMTPQEQADEVSRYFSSGEWKQAAATTFKQALLQSGMMMGAAKGVQHLDAKIRGEQSPLTDGVAFQPQNLPPVNPERQGRVDKLAGIMANESERTAQMRLNIANQRRDQQPVTAPPAQQIEQVAPEAVQPVVPVAESAQPQEITAKIAQTAEAPAATGPTPEPAATSATAQDEEAIAPELADLLRRKTNLEKAIFAADGTEKKTATKRMKDNYAALTATITALQPQNPEQEVIANGQQAEPEATAAEPGAVATDGAGGAGGAGGAAPAAETGMGSSEAMPGGTVSGVDEQSGDGVPVLRTQPDVTEAPQASPDIMALVDGKTDDQVQKTIDMVRGLNPERASQIEAYWKSKATPAPESQTGQEPAPAAQDGRESVPPAGDAIEPYEATLYRGTAKRSSLHSGGMGRGEYLTSDPDIADSYAKDFSDIPGTVAEKKVRLEKPLYADTLDDVFAFVGNISDELYRPGMSLNQHEALLQDEITERLTAQGYDGIVLRKSLNPRTNEYVDADEVLIFPKGVSSPAGDATQKGEEVDSQQRETAEVAPIPAGRKAHIEKMIERHGGVEKLPPAWREQWDRINAQEAEQQGDTATPASSVPSATSGRALFTADQLAELDKRGIDVSKVTAQYKSEALQQLGFQQEQESKLASPDYDANVQAEYDRIEAARKETVPSPRPEPAKQSVDKRLDPTSMEVRLDSKLRSKAIKQSKESGAKHLDQVEHSVEAMRGKRIRSIFDGSTGTITSANSDNSINMVWDDEKSAGHNSASLEEYPSGRNGKTVQQWTSRLTRHDISDFEILPETRRVSRGVVTQPPVPKPFLKPLVTPSEDQGKTAATSGPSGGTANVVSPEKVKQVAQEIKTLRDRAQTISESIQGKILPNGVVVGRTGGAKGDRMAKRADEMRQKANSLEDNWYAALHPESFTPEEMEEAKAKGMPVVAAPDTAGQKAAQPNENRDSAKILETLEIAWPTQMQRFDAIEKENGEFSETDEYWRRRPSKEAAIAYIKEQKAKGENGTVQDYLSELAGMAGSEYAKYEGAQPPPLSPVAAHDAFMSRLSEGDATPDELKASFASLQENRDSIKAELGKLKKDDLLKRLGRMEAYRYKNDKKEIVVNAVFRRMLSSHNLSGTIQYNPMEKGAMDAALKAKVDATTERDIADHAEQIKAAREGAKKRVEGLVKSAKNPETWEEFQNFIRMHKDKGGIDALTPEQRKRYDELHAEHNKEAAAKQIYRKAHVREAGAQVDSEIIETAHTKTKEPLFVVKAADRVDKDVYKEWNATAKKLGGWYSSYRAGGAVPGFQFKTRESAESFKQYLKGDASTASETIKERIEERQESKKQSAADKLAALADSMEEKANGVLNADRLTNTAKRAQQAESTDASARKTIALATTIRNIARAIQAGEAKHLEGISAGTHVETLDAVLSAAKYTNLRENGPSDWSVSDERYRMPNESDMDYVEYPYPNPHQDHIKEIGLVLREKSGAVKDGEWLMKRYAVTSGNDSSVITFTSPSDIERLESVLAKAKKVPRLKSAVENVTERMAKYKRLQKMNIPDEPTLRAALREYLQFKDEGPKADKAKQLERQLAGNKSVGIDFFPTPPAVAADLVERARIEPGMKVLEPSGGTGNIAEEIRKAGGDVDVAEISGQMRDLLDAKGFNLVAHDFMDFDEGGYDAIVMNPPFSADIEHVRHAFDLLKPGGRLVSIVGEGSFGNQKKHTEFQEWLDEHGATVEKLPQGTFTDRTQLKTTGANARVVEMVKGGEAEVAPVIPEQTLIDTELLRQHYSDSTLWQYRTAPEGTWFTANRKEDAVERAAEGYDKLPPEERLTREERDAKADRERYETMEARYGRQSIPELEARLSGLGGKIASLQKAGVREFDGNGGRRTSAAVSNEGARDAGQEKLDLTFYLNERKAKEGYRPTVSRLTPAGKRGSAQAYTVHLSPSQAMSLKEIRQEVSDGEAGGRAGIYNDSAPGTTQVSWGSSFPEYFQNKGLTKKQVLPILDRIIQGKPVTETQWLIAEDMLKAKRYDTLNRILNERAEKQAESHVGMSQEDLDAAKEDALDFFAQFGGEDEATEETTGAVRADEREGAGRGGASSVDTDRGATPTADTIDESGWGQQVASELSGDKKQVRFGDKRQAGRNVGLSEFMDEFTPDPQGGLFGGAPTLDSMGLQQIYERLADTKLVKDAMADLKRLGMHVYAQGSTAWKPWFQGMKDSLGKLFRRFRPTMEKLYATTKSDVRYSVNNKGGKDADNNGFAGGKGIHSNERQDNASARPHDRGLSQYADSESESHAERVRRLAEIISEDLGGRPIVLSVARQGSEADDGRRVSGAFGRELIYVTNHSKDIIDFHGVVFDDKTIFIEEDTPLPHMVVIGHELLHSIKLADENNGTSHYNDFANAIKKEVELNGYLAYVKDKRAVLLDPGVAPEMVYEEVLGDFIGDRLTDKDFWNKIFRTQPSLARRVMQSIKALVEKAKGHFKKTDAIFKDLQKAENMAADFLARHMRKVARGTVSAEESAPVATKYSLRTDRTGDPRVDAVLDKIGSPDKTLADRIKDSLGNLAHKETRMREIEQGFFDRYASLHYLDKMAGITSPDDSAYISARMTTSFSDVMYAMVHHGHPIWKDGGSAVQGKGLMEIFKPVADELDVFMGWMVGARAQKLMNEGRERYFDQDEINILKGLKTPENSARWEKVRRDYMQYKKQVLDFAEQAGVINPEARRIWDHEEYVPFYRVVEDKPKGPFKVKGLASQNSGIRTLKGADERLGDIFENIIRNFSHLTDASIKNRATELAVQKAEQIGAATPAPLEWKAVKIGNQQVVDAVHEFFGETQDDIDAFVNPEEMEAFTTFFHPAKPMGKDVIHVLRDGKPQYYQVHDDLLLRSMTSINEQIWGGPAMATMRFVKRLLTIGVTSDPTFMLRNFIRDTLHTWTISRGDFTPVISSLTGAVKAFREDDDMVQLMAAGGAFHGGFAYGNDPAAVKLMVRKLITKKGIDRNTILDTVKKVWEAYQEIGSAMENAARVQTYANVKAKTGSHLQAAFDAKDIMDFSVRGDWAAINFLTQTVPFLGARIQGLQRLGKGAMENPVAFTLKGTAIALASTLLWLHNRLRPEYQELEEWDKDTYFHFFVGKKHFRLPKPFEVGAIFGTMPERLMELTLEKQHDGGLFFERMMAILTQTFAVGLPQILNEPMQQWANKDFFTGREIVGRDLQRLLPGEQSNPYTSATAKELGRAIHVSPRRLEHAVKGYFGALGMYCMGASDILVRKLWDYPSEPATKPEDWPVLSAFYRGEGPARNTKYTTEFYELLREADQLTDTIQRLRETGEVPRSDKLIEKNLPKLAVGGILGQVQSELSRINKQMKRVHLDRSMSPDEKKEQLVELQRIKNDITRGVVGQAKAAMD